VSWPLLLLLLGCPAQVPSPQPYGTEQASPETVQDLAGKIRDGVFRDEKHGWELSIPEGWVAYPGPRGGLMRVAVDRVASDVRVEVWVFPGTADLSARQREGCFWSYQSEGHFTALLGGGPVYTATCVPDDPARPRIFATITRREGKTLQVEVHAPAEMLVEAKRAGDALTRGLVW
jgi:hypothetical protein